MDPNIIPLVAIVMGISVVLVPVIGLTARYVLRPFAEALALAFHARGTEEAVQLLERRMALLEQQLEAMETSLARLSEAADFHHELRALPHASHAHAPHTPLHHVAPGAPPNDARP